MTLTPCPQYVIDEAAGATGAVWQAVCDDGRWFPYPYSFRAELLADVLAGVVAEPTTDAQRFAIARAVMGADVEQYALAPAVGGGYGYRAGVTYVRPQGRPSEVAPDGRHGWCWSDGSDSGIGRYARTFLDAVRELHAALDVA